MLYVVYGILFRWGKNRKLHACTFRGICKVIFFCNIPIIPSVYLASPIAKRKIQV